MDFKMKEQILTKKLVEQIDLILFSHNNDASQLVGILLDIQMIIPRQYIPEQVAYYLAEKLNTKITNVYDVISFYAALSDKPRAKYPIQICDSIVCKINDNTTIFTVLKEILGIEINEVTYDGRFTIEKVPCFGACDVAPAVRINGKVYGHLTSREKIIALLDALG